MTALRGIFFVIGIISLLLCAVLYWADGTLYVQLLVLALAMIGGALFYTWYDGWVSQRDGQTLRKAIEGIKSSWLPIEVPPSDVEIKSSSSVNAVGQSGGMVDSGFVAAFQPIAILDAAKHDDGRGPGTEMFSQSVLLVRRELNGQMRVLHSHLILKDATTITFLLHQLPMLTIYINPTNPQECFFDVFLD